MDAPHLYFTHVLLGCRLSSFIESPNEKKTENEGGTFDINSIPTFPELIYL